MLKNIRSFALATLVFSLTFTVYLAISTSTVKYTLAQTIANPNRKAEADKLLQ